MPMTAAHARKLMHQGKARLVPHHALTVVQLEQVLPEPVLRPVVAGVAIHFNTAELFLLAAGTRKTFPLLRLIVDLRTDLPWRIRRRAMFRRRRRFRGRYRPPRRHGRPFKRPGPVTSRPRRHTQTRTASPTIQWRAQAIQRVISALQRLVPISHVVVLEPSTPERHRAPSLSPSERRQQLIAAYGTPDAAGQRHARCAYCGTTRGPIVVDHIVPESRGGTGVWSNLALACKACNDRKRDRTPEEAGMSVRFPPGPEPAPPQRARPYVRQTAHALLHARTTDHWINRMYAPEMRCWLLLSRLLHADQRWFTRLLF
jgi:5-methylcytosine-specific restriction endonuclease McrA